MTKGTEESQMNASSFEVRAADLAGRLGILEIKGRKIRTPELMPVVNPNKLTEDWSVSPEELEKDFRFQAIITNSYIIRKTPELSEKALDEGLHRMLRFNGAIMTDSGTFQSYIYGGGEGEVDLDPVEIVEYQSNIGSDIGTILDRFTVPEADRIRAEEDIRITMERASASIAHAGGMELAVPVQGGSFTDLRELSGNEVRKMGAGYAPIGGVVPIMESYRYDLLVDVIAAAKSGLGHAVPSHLFGAGHPMILPLAAAMGCDLFDSASYAKFAEAGRYMTEGRTRHFSELEELPCSCRACSGTDADDLREMAEPDRKGILARHNLRILRSAVSAIRDAISEGTLWELVERSAAFHPSLYSAVRRLKEHSKLLEENSPRSTRRFMCSSGLALARPEFSRFASGLREVRPWHRGESVLVHDDWSTVFSRKIHSRLNDLVSDGSKVIVRTPLGPAPFEALQMYPLAQSIFPSPDHLGTELRAHTENMMDEFLGNCVLKSVSGSELNDEAKVNGSIRDAVDLISIRSILRFQFGSSEGTWADEAMFPDTRGLENLRKRLRLKRSKRTGKLRNVLWVTDEGDVRHLISLRADDGLFSLKWEGALRLLSAGGERWRVQVEEGTEEYNSKGYNVFSRFVMDCDPRIRPGDEVLVVDAEDGLHAVGRAVVGARLMKEARSGMAVRVREGAEKAMSR